MLTIESYLELRESYWDADLWKHKIPFDIIPFDTLENRIKRVKEAIALAEGDMRRYGEVLKSTREDFHASINCLINLNNFPSAKYFLSKYRRLDGGSN